MFCRNCGFELKGQESFCPNCGYKIMPSRYVPQEKVVAEPAANLGKPKKKSHFKVIAGAALGFFALGCLAAAGIVFGPMVIDKIGGGSFSESNPLSGLGSKDAYVYTSNGEYILTYDLEKDLSIEIDYSGGDEGLMFFSPDKKYLYYAKNIDSDNSTLTLCRAEYGKLKANSENNERYIETIADHVSLSIRLFGNNVTYIDAYGNLYYYNGEESVFLGSNVGTYYQDEETNRIVYVTCDEEKDENAFSLYGVDLTVDNPGENCIRIASEADCVEDISDFDNILYAIVDSDGTRDLYAAGFDRIVGKLADNVYVCDDNVLYSTMEDGKKYFVSLDEDEESGTIYLYDNGKVTQVQKIYYVPAPGENGLLFSDDENVTSDNWTDHLKVLLKDGSICDVELPEFVIDAMEWDEIYVFFIGDHIYFEYDNDESSTGYAIASAEVNNGEIGEITKITDDGFYYASFYDGEYFYYNSNSRGDGYNTYYDLYFYDGKENHLLEENFNYFMGNITFYENGIFIDKTYSDDNQSVSYSIGQTSGNEDGKTTSIIENAENTTSFLVLDTDEILYCNDDALYCFDGTYSIFMKNNVDQIICNNTISPLGRDISGHLYYYNLPFPNHYMYMSNQEKKVLFR